MNLQQIDSRSREILCQAVNIFIAHGEPVGSRTLSKMNPYGLSPATIRNIMSDLEETGYVYQPHTSAGRVPTDKGYRFYVSTLVKGGGLSRREQQMIGTSLDKTERGVEALAKQTSRLLSHMTDTVSFVIRPDIRQSTLRHINFVKLGSRRILVVLVSLTGQVINRVIEIAEELSSDELHRCARYLEAEFANSTLLDAREAILSRLKEMQAIYDRMVENALALGKAAFAENLAPTDVYLDGTSRMLAKPEFKTDIDRARQLLSTLEQKSRLVEILNVCLDGQGLQIVIGSEAQVPDFEGISLIAARYRFCDQELGSLGIMGPTRMEYARVMSIVDYIAQSLSEAISQTGDEPAN